MAEERITIEQVEEAIRKVYLLKDEGIVKLILGATLSNRICRTEPPVWLIILGGSSSGKTIMLNLISKCGKWVVPIDTLSANSFLSGFKGQSTSVLDDARQGVIVFKDFTTITSMNEDTLREVMGQMRAIYDGEFSKRTGNATSSVWKGKVGILGAGTIDVQRKMRQYAKNGERFLNYIPEIADAKEIGYRAMANLKDIKLKEDDLADLVAKFVAQQERTKFEMDYLTNADFEKEMVDIADFVTLARSPVEMSFKDPRQVNFVGDREIPGRMAMMLKSLGIGIMMVCDVSFLTPSISKILYKVALDSIPVERKKIITLLSQYREASTKSLAFRLGLPTETVRAWLAQVNAVGIIERMVGKPGKRNTDYWAVKPEYKALMVKYLDIVPEDSELELTPEEEAKNAYLEAMPVALADVNPPTLEDIEMDAVFDNF